MNPDLAEYLAATLRGEPVKEVLLQRIALAQEQATALQIELAKERIEKEKLVAEVEMMRDALRQRAARIRELEDAAIQKQQGRRGEGEEKILVTMAGGRSLTVSQIHQMTGIDRDDIDVMLSDLRDADLVTAQSFTSYGFEPRRPTLWSLQIEGKRYVTTHSLGAR